MQHGHTDLMREDFIITERKIVPSAVDVDPQLVKNISDRIERDLLQAISYGPVSGFANKNEENYSNEAPPPLIVGFAKLVVT